MSKLKVAIICGGPSSEHEVSCVSGGGVLKGLDRKSFDPILIGITKAGKWVALDENYSLSIINKAMPTIEDNGSSVELSQGGLIIDGTFAPIDCIFSILHGEFGEDGKIQKLFEDANIPYVGSGVKASADAMDKAHAKELFAAAGLKVAPGIVVKQGDVLPSAESLSYPVFVKPSSGGSSRGTHKVKTEEKLLAAIEDAFLYDDKVLIENAINGREIECAVLERDGTSYASVVGEIVVNPRFEFYDFEAKYLDNATTVKIPADISGEDAQANEAVESVLEGDDIEIAFNPTYLLDGLAALDAPYVRMSFTQSTRPAVLTGAADPSSELRDDYRYLLMPVRLTG